MRSKAIIVILLLLGSSIALALQNDTPNIPEIRLSVETGQDDITEPFFEYCWPVGEGNNVCDFVLPTSFEDYANPVSIPPGQEITVILNNSPRNPDSLTVRVVDLINPTSGEPAEFPLNPANQSIFDTTPLPNGEHLLEIRALYNELQGVSAAFVSYRFAVIVEGGAEVAQGATDETPTEEVSEDETPTPPPTEEDTPTPTPTEEETVEDTPTPTPTEEELVDDDTSTPDEASLPLATDESDDDTTPMGQVDVDDTPTDEAEDDTPTPTPTEEEVEDDDTPTPTPTEEELVDDDTPTPTSTEEEAVEDDTPTPTPTEEEVEDDNTPTPTPTEEEVEDDDTPSPTPTPTEEEVVEDDTPTPTPTEEEVVEDDTPSPVSNATATTVPLNVDGNNGNNTGPSPTSAIAQPAEPPMIELIFAGQTYRPVGVDFCQLNSGGGDRICVERPLESEGATIALLQDFAVQVRLPEGPRPATIDFAYVDPSTQTVVSTETREGDFLVLYNIDVEPGNYFLRVSINWGTTDADYFFRVRVES